MSGTRKYTRSRKKIEQAIDRKNRPALESALEEFQELLLTETVKRKEKEFLIIANEEKVYLTALEGIFIP